MNARGNSVFRVVFGAYLVLHFGMLVPYAAELFGSAGLVPDPVLNPLHGLFPNPLAVWDIATPWCVALTLLAGCFMLGWWPRMAALLMWFGSTALFHRNNLTANPSLAYLGLMLVLCALARRDGSLPRMALVCAWVLLAVGYTFSGITKLESASWIDGSAMIRLMENPLVRDWSPRVWMMALPAWMLQMLTWGTLALELLFLPLCTFANGRKWAWIAAVSMHLGILMLVDFADLTLGMLMVHLFVFDAAWVPARWRATSGYRFLFLYETHPTVS
ncbi:MAG: HTTM domain-containing protein [Verrucomicrobiaceae bacterium]|nr:HTTM domain-containing protein [Verrucomicrobiaceae bacterium]